MTKDDMKYAVAKLCWDRIALLELSGVYVDRLELELKELFRLGMEEYLYIVSDYCKFCRKAGIAYGYGRGSSVGSLVCYLLEITKIDPIKHDLSFFRFIGGHKPDIDLDVDSQMRDILIRYLKKTYKNVYRVFSVDINGLKRLNPVSLYIGNNNILETEKVSGEDAIEASKANIKYDILSSTIIGRYFGIIRKHNVVINYEDEEVWQSIWKDVKGLYQINTPYSGLCIFKIKPKNIEELSDALAIIRTRKLKTYLYRKRLWWKYPGKLYGMTIYQEQFLEELRKYVSDEDAFKIMKDKTGKYTDTVKKASYKLIEMYEDSKSGYMYNKSHGIAYAYMIYIGAYLRYYYQDEFMKQENKIKEQYNWKEVSPTSGYNTHMVGSELRFGFDIFGDKELYNIVRSINKKNILLKLKGLKSSTAVKMLSMGVFESILSLNNIDCVNLYYDYIGSKKRIRYFNKEEAYRRAYEEYCQRI